MQHYLSHPNTGARTLGNSLPSLPQRFAQCRSLYRSSGPVGYPGEPRARFNRSYTQIVLSSSTITALFVAIGVFFQVPVPSLWRGSRTRIPIFLNRYRSDFVTALGNILPGSWQAGKAYRVETGWIVDGKHLEVVEIHWRSTRLRNNAAVTFDIHNNQRATSPTIVNL